MKTMRTYVLAAVVALALVAALAFPRAEAVFVKRAQDTSTETLALVKGALDQAVGRYEPLPELVADDLILKDLLKQPDNDGLIPFINEKLRLLAISLDVSDIYLLDRTGLTVAASNYRKDASFIGKSFEYRPYFQDAMTGESARFHALGTTSGERGFFFSAPILDGIDVIGVLTVKVTVAQMEASWVDLEREVLVADPNGIVFLANREDHRMKSLAPLADGQRQRIAQTRQYPLDQLQPLPLSTSLLSHGAVEVTLKENSVETDFLSTSTPLQMGGWHAIVLTPLQPVRLQALYSVVVIAITLTAFLLALLVVHQRRARLLDRVRMETDQRNLLEVKVLERTADLDAANANLLVEIAERKRTEDRLRKSQKELIQAGKLAALGKMSAALSHEINQPLAAVKAYADNAAQFLARNRPEEVSDNIARISDMADRMAQISKHLRGFARQPGDKLSAIPVGEVIQKALDVSAPMLRDREVTVVFVPRHPEVWGLGGALRLQQVIVNLVNNAADAMASGEDKRVEISVTPSEDEVRIDVRDFGPGLAPDALDQVFEAFYTTKEAGIGMGLGLSISYNIIEDFGGRLMVRNHAERGAIFTIVLKREAAADLPQPTEAAE